MHACSLARACVQVRTEAARDYLRSLKPKRPEDLNKRYPTAGEWWSWCTLAAGTGTILWPPFACISMSLPPLILVAPHPGRRCCLPLPLPAAAGAEATDLLRKFLRFNPEDRITIDEVSGGGHVTQWPPPASNHHQRGGGSADGLSSAS